MTIFFFVLGVSYVFAQTPSIRVNSAEIQFFKQLTFKEGAKIAAPGSLILDLPKCDFSIVHGIRPISVGIIGGTTNAIGTNSPGIDSDNYNYAEIRPSLNLFMDLGDNGHRFNNGYIQQVWSPNSIKTPSDCRLKDNIMDLENPMEKIMKLRPVSFNMKAVEEYQDTADLKGKAGFIAQEMLSVFPRLVSTIPGTDLYAVEYGSLIPYMVKAFQSEHVEKEELKSQVEDLCRQVADLQEIVQSLLAANQAEYDSRSKGNALAQSPKNTVKEAKLFQNKPNPFSQGTMIRYELPRAAGNAFIHVYDATGRLIKDFSLPHAQEAGQAEISGGDLLPGTYTYSLVVSGKVMDSKRMVVTQ